MCVHREDLAWHIQSADGLLRDLVDGAGITEPGWDGGHDRVGDEGESAKGEQRRGEAVVLRPTLEPPQETNDERSSVVREVDPGCEYILPVERTRVVEPRLQPDRGKLATKESAFDP